MPIHDRTLGENLRRVRCHACMTQKDFVQHLTSIKTPEHYCHLENGKRHITLETLDEICEKFNVSYEEVLRGATNAKLRAEGNETLPPSYADQFARITAGHSANAIETALRTCREIMLLEQRLTREETAKETD